MQAAIHHIHNPLEPARGMQSFALAERQTVAGVIERLDLHFERPYICLVNSEPVLRGRWPELEIRDRDVVIFAEMFPGDGGGGGSNPLKIVAMIVVVAAAAYTGQWEALGAYAPAAGAAVAVAGTALISAAFPPPSLPSSQKMAALAAPSPTYSLQAQGNTVRLGEPIPSWYGRHIIYPDFAAIPYSEFKGNDQYLYQLLSVGHGSFDIAEIRIEDTPIASFAEITTEIVGPGGTVTLFPTDVITAVEVAGQELLTNTTVGPFIANPAGSTANKFAIDVVCPKGLYYANDAGSLDARSVSWRVEYQQVDDAGVPVGGWIVAGNETINAATNTPQRRSYEYTATVPRFQVKLTRTNAKSTNTRVGNDLNWTGLRAYIPGNQQYGDITVIAMVMRATNNLSQQSSRKVNLTGTRELPTWSTAGGWTAPIATRNPAWAIADAAKAKYGGKLTDSQINLSRLETLAATWDARGDYFDGGFDQALVLLEALTQIAKVGRAQPYVQAGMLQVVRDEPVTLPAASFCGRNILRGDISIDYHTPTPETADEVTIEYMDAATWSYKTVTSDLIGATPQNPVKLPFFGITNRDQAYREAMFLAACNRYRRKTGQFPVELEGQLLSLLDLADITHDLISWGQGGEVTDWVDASQTLTLSEELTWGVGDHYISLRGRDGRKNGPWLATAGVNSNQVVVAAGLGAFVPDTDPAVRERTYYQFGEGDKRSQEYRITGIKPQSENRIMLSVVNENPLVHTADQSPVPAPAAAWNLVKKPTKPVMSPLSVVQGGTVNSPVLHISWMPVHGADHYLISQSADNFAWTPVGDTVNSDYQLPVAEGYVYLRVIAVGLTASEPVYWEGEAGALAPPGDVQNLVLVGDADGDVRKISWDKTARATGYIVEVWAAGAPWRSETISENTYSYSVDEAYTDGGPWRDVTFKVKAVGVFGNSDNWVSLLTSNPAPDMSANLPTLTPVYRGLKVDWTAIASNDRDLKKYVVYCDTNNPPVAPMATVGAETTVTMIPNLDPDLTYYVQIEPWDSFGAGVKSDIPGSQPAVIPPADVNVELNASIAMSDSMGTAAGALAKLYDRNVATDGVVYNLGGADKWTQYLFGLTNYIDRVIVHAASGTARVYFAYSDDGIVWSYLAAEADHTLTATGELVAMADQAAAIGSYLQLAAGANVAVFPQRLTAKYCRMYMTGTWTDEFYELVFARLKVAEEMAVDKLSALSANLGTILAGLMQSPSWVSSSGVDGMMIDLAAELIKISKDIVLDGPNKRIVVGDNQIVIDAVTNDITVSPAGGTAGSNYVQLTNGEINFYDYYGGAHHLYKSLRKTKYGICSDGQVVNLGYFRSAPQIILSPYNLQSYNKAYPGKNQTFKLFADTPYLSGDDWLFHANCKLLLGGGTTDGGAATVAGCTPVDNSTAWGTYGYGGHTSIADPGVYQCTIIADLSYYAQGVDYQPKPGTLEVTTQAYYSGSWHDMEVFTFANVGNGSAWAYTATLDIGVAPSAITYIRLKIRAKQSAAYNLSDPAPPLSFYGASATVTGSTYTSSETAISADGQANYLAIG